MINQVLILFTLLFGYLYGWSLTFNSEISTIAGYLTISYFIVIKYYVYFTSNYEQNSNKNSRTYDEIKDQLIDDYDLHNPCTMVNAVKEFINEGLHVKNPQKL
jgi:spore cortex formation protein SpoVR/YcgB (stage V sporulation)